MKRYTTADIVSLLNKNERTVRRWIADLISIDKGKYVVSEDILKLLEIRANSDNVRTDIGQDPDIENEDFEADYIEGFTTVEYIEFQKRINEYPVLKNYIDNLEKQIEYFRFSHNKQLEINEKQTQTINELSQGIKQRNFIEAKEKGFDNQEIKI